MKQTNLENLKVELVNITNSIVVKHNEKSVKDVTVQIQTVTPKYHKGIKKVVINYETEKSNITLYRSFVNTTLQKVLSIKKEEFYSLLAYVEEMGLYQAYNLFVSSIMKNEKSVFLGE